MAVKKNHIYPGIFISFEGGEGCGKSTQIKILYNYLKTQNCNVELIREPGSTQVGENIRNILLNIKDLKICAETELLLYEAARAQIVKDTIIPLLQEGKIVLCDRFIDSTYAYQGYARELDLDTINKLNDFACFQVYPDKTIFLHINADLGLKRATHSDKNQADRIESEGLEFHKKVEAGFMECALKNKNRFSIINTAKEKHDTQLKIFNEIKHFIPQVKMPTIEEIDRIAEEIKKERYDKA